MSPVELIAAGTGIAGALLIAWRGKYAGWAWVLWVISSVAWIAFAFKVQSVALLAQQAIFAGINLLGVYRWLIQDQGYRR